MFIKLIVSVDFLYHVGCEYIICESISQSTIRYFNWPRIIKKKIEKLEKKNVISTLLINVVYYSNGIKFNATYRLKWH
jgi:hypothetical protein